MLTDFKNAEHCNWIYWLNSFTFWIRMINFHSTSSKHLNSSDDTQLRECWLTRFNWRVYLWHAPLKELLSNWRRSSSTKKDSHDNRSVIKKSAHNTNFAHRYLIFIWLIRFSMAFKHFLFDECLRRGKYYQIRNNIGEECSIVFSSLIYW